MNEPEQLAADRYQQLDFLLFGIELAKNDWKIAFSNGKQTCIETIDARHLGHLRDLIDEYLDRFDLPADAEVTSCYEAGQDGFWLHRWLREHLEVKNHVVDPSSIEDNSRAREAKTDRIDAEKLVSKLVQYHRGDGGVFSICNVPGREVQDRRRLSRERTHLKRQRQSVTNRIRSLLRLKGIEKVDLDGLRDRLDEIETPHGEKLRPARKKEVKRLLKRREHLTRQLREVIREQNRMVEENQDREWVQVINRLRSLKGIALNTAWRLAIEAFLWREFSNRGEVGGCFGLDPAPHATGESERKQGISKAGSNRLRDLAVQVAWNWVRHQPRSELTRWFLRNFDQDSREDRKRGIVALARKLMIRLYRWSTDPDGERPWGSELNRSDLLEKAG